MKKIQQLLMMAIVAISITATSCAGDRCPRFADNNNRSNQLSCSVNDDVFMAPTYHDSDIRYMTIKITKANGKTEIIKRQAWLPVCLGQFKGRTVLCDARNSILANKVVDYEVIRSEKQPY